MKKEKIVFVMALISIIISSIISVYAANYLYNSQDVEYDNIGKNITSTNVQGAIDELYIDANNYSSINTRVTNLETTISGKQNTITGGASTITSSNLTANRALVSNASGKVAASSITSTQLGYLSGVTSNIQTQLNNLNNSINNKTQFTFTNSIGTLRNSYCYKSGNVYTLSIRVSGLEGLIEDKGEILLGTIPSTYAPSGVAWFSLAYVGHKSGHGYGYISTDGTVRISIGSGEIGQIMFSVSYIK